MEIRFYKMWSYSEKNAPFWFLGLLHQFFFGSSLHFCDSCNFSRETAECQKYYFEGYGIKFNF